jgi:hypothetical protein
MQKEKAKKRGVKEVFHGPIVEADTKINVANYLSFALLGYLYVGTPV